MRIIYCSVVDGKLEFDLGHIRKIVLPETPSVPVGLLATDITGGKVELQWDNVGDASRWDVYRDSVFQATVNTAGYIDTTVSPSTVYEYQVTASNLGTSALSAILEVTTAANSTPIWSIADQVAFLSTSYTLDLDTVCDDVDDHDITYSIVSGGISGLAVTGNILQQLSPSVVTSTNLTLRANDGFGTSDVTIAYAVRDPDVTAPSVPGSPVASVTGTTVTFTWTASTDTNGISHYRVFRDGVFQDTTTSLQYTDSDLANGTYVYSVSAIDGSTNANESAQASAAAVVVLVVDPNPDTPINVIATQDPPSSIDVTWQEGPGGADPDDYDVQYATAIGGPYTTWPHTGTTTSTTITGLSAGTYFIQVRANNGGNSSSFCPPVQVTLTPGGTADFTITAQTGARTWDGGPSGFNVQPGDIIQLSSGTHGRIKFTNIIGNSNNRVLIRGPSTGTATIRSNTIVSSNYIVEFANCRYVDVDGISSATTPAGPRPKSRCIKVTYATNATALNPDSPTGWVKLSGTTTSSFTMSRNIRIKHIEIDGGYPTFSDHGIAVQGQDHSFKNSAFPMDDGFWLEDVILEHCYIHNVHGEGMYLGTNPYQAVRPNLPVNQQGAGIGLRYIKIRYNDIVDCGGSGINPKSVFGGTSGGDGTTENSIHHNVIIRCGTAPDTNGAASISANSCKFDIYNNWIEDGGGQGITCNISEGTNVIDPALTFTSRIYNNVIRNCDTSGIFGTAHGTIPSGMRPTLRSFNNTITGNTNQGVNYSVVHTSSWVRNCVSVDNGGTNISAGAGTKTSNLETGTAGVTFVDPVGTYEAGNVDLELNSSSLASGTMGSGLPGTWPSTVDIAPTDYDDESRGVNPDKGAYEL